MLQPTALPSTALASRRKASPATRHGNPLNSLGRGRPPSLPGRPPPQPCAGGSLGDLRSPRGTSRVLASHSPLQCSVVPGSPHPLTDLQAGPPPGFSALLSQSGRRVSVSRIWAFVHFPLGCTYGEATTWCSPQGAWLSPVSGPLQASTTECPCSQGGWTEPGRAPWSGVRGWEGEQEEDT